MVWKTKYRGHTPDRDKGIGELTKLSFPTFFLNLPATLLSPRVKYPALSNEYQYLSAK
jgi:hypothetical protein